MKILYISDLFSGLRGIFLEGKTENVGSPAFFEPLKYMIEQGNKVDFIFPVFNKTKPSEISSPIISNSLIRFYYYRKNILLRPFIIIHLLYFLKKSIRKGNYDFVYCHGSFGTYGNIAANLMKVPAGHRIYGSFLYFKINKYNNLFLAIRFYRQYLPFILKKKFLLMTNDGTQGDELYKLIGCKNYYSFHYLLNGVDKEFYCKTEPITINENYLLLYPGRIESWKNQEFAIQIMYELNKIRKIRDIRLLFVGTIYNTKYFDYLNSIIKGYELDNQVQFLNAVDKTILKQFFDNAFAILSFYKFSNLGNVSIEALTSGSLLISLNDGSFGKLVKNEQDCILVNSANEGAYWINTLINNRTLYTNIRNNALALAQSSFLSWRQRSIIEYNIINKYTI